MKADTAMRSLLVTGGVEIISIGTLNKIVRYLLTSQRKVIIMTGMASTSSLKMGIAPYDITLEGNRYAKKNSRK